MCPDQGDLTNGPDQVYLSFDNTSIRKDLGVRDNPVDRLSTIQKTLKL